ncbi:MAG: prolipoprotein diacylglyceryl transferase [Tissierellia bacterium]|nr:prolipoprotein diacylglyceryl transferase [Tissierellia bacterium]
MSILSAIKVNNNPVAFKILGINIYWYAIIIITGILISAYIAKKEFIRYGYDGDFIYDFLIVMLPSAIICARIWYVVFEWDYYKLNPSQIINIRAGGLAIHGGIIGALIASYFFSKKRNIQLIDLADVVFPSVALGQAIGRWGNFMNMEAYGYPTNLPWAMEINGVGVHPTFLYESIGDLLIFIFLYLRRKKNVNRGSQTALYLIFYGILRFFVEGLRTDSLYILGLRTAQLMSLLFIIIGIILFIKSKSMGEIDENFKKQRKHQDIY